MIKRNQVHVGQSFFLFYMSRPTLQSQFHGFANASSPRFADDSVVVNKQLSFEIELPFVDWSGHQDVQIEEPPLSELNVMLAEHAARAGEASKRAFPPPSADVLQAFSDFNEADIDWGDGEAEVDSSQQGDDEDRSRGSERQSRTQAPKDSSCSAQNSRTQAQNIQWVIPESKTGVAGPDIPESRRRQIRAAAKQTPSGPISEFARCNFRTGVQRTGNNEWGDYKEFDPQATNNILIVQVVVGMECNAKEFAQSIN